MFGEIELGIALYSPNPPLSGEHLGCTFKYSQYGRYSYLIQGVDIRSCLAVQAGWRVSSIRYFPTFPYHCASEPMGARGAHSLATPSQWEALTQIFTTIQRTACRLRRQSFVYKTQVYAASTCCSVIYQDLLWILSDYELFL